MVLHVKAFPTDLLRHAKMAAADRRISLRAFVIQTIASEVASWGGPDAKQAALAARKETLAKGGT